MPAWSQTGDFSIPDPATAPTTSAVGVYHTTSFSPAAGDDSKIESISLRAKGEQKRLTIKVRPDNYEAFAALLKDAGFEIGVLSAAKKCHEFNSNQLSGEPNEEQANLWKLLKIANAFSPIPQKVADDIATCFGITPIDIRPSLLDLVISEICSNRDLFQYAMATEGMPQHLNRLLAERVSDAESKGR